MSIVMRLWTTCMVLIGAVTASQVPEFSQQYKQRLGGGIEEITRIVEQFDDDAAANNLSRDEAIASMQTSEDEFVKRRAKSVAAIIDRRQNLVEQLRLMTNASAFEQPLYLAQYPDAPLVTGTFDDYQPAVPFTPAGFAYGFFGAVLLYLVGKLPFAFFRLFRKKSSRPRITAET